MASIQSLGVGSGLLTSELVEDIIASEREATDLRIDARKAEFEARISAFGAIKSSLSKLQSAASGLSGASTLLSTTAVSSNEQAVIATSTAAAKPGVHSVEVGSLARAHTLASQQYETLDSVVGDGTLTFRFGTTTFDGSDYDSFEANPDRTEAVVTIGSDNNTLEGVRDAVNDAGIGVTASIINNGDGYVLVFASDDSGADNGLEITVAEDTTPGLAALAFNADASTPGTNLTQTVAADDAVVFIDGIQIRRESNEIADVIEGVTFTATSVNLGTPANITISQDTQGIVERMQSFVDSYNEVKALADELTAFDEDSGTGALLMGDATLRGIRTQLRRFLTGGVLGVESTSLRALVDLGVTTDQNNRYQLKLDAQTLTTALQTSPQDVAALLATERRASDELIRFTSFQKGTQAGDYDVEITTIATQGYLQGASVAGLDGPVVIDDDNDSVTVKIDGSTSGPISIPQGSYTDGAELAIALQAAINADSALKATGKSVEVSYDTDDQRLVFTSDSYGSKSQVGVTAVDTNTEATLGLVVDAGDSTSGVDVAGTINGIDGAGSGQFLSVPQGQVAATAGYYRGASVASFDAPPLTLDANNSSFTLSVDGVTTELVQLTQGDYDSGTELAAELQARINADANLTAQAKEVSVVYDGVNGLFEIRSASTGTESIVEFVDVPAGVESDLGFSAGGGTAGRAATEVSDPAGGVQIQVLGGETGARGQVTLVRGAMNRFEQYLSSQISFGGGLDEKLSNLEERLTELDEEAVEFDKRMDALEDRLRLQFAAADALISELNSTSQFLTQQLDTLPGYTQSKD